MILETVCSLLEVRLRAALDGVEANVSAATDARFGDYQTNVAMVLAKQRRANPRQLAQEIIDKIDVAEMCAPPEIAGAGFINFRLKPEWLAERFTALVNDAQLGVPAPEKPRQLVIDFSSPNVAKPMHVGHIRSTILGDALARIAAFIGHRVVRDNHIGDWGKQFGMLLSGWKRYVAKNGSAPQTIEELEQIYRETNAAVERDTWAEIKMPDGLVGESSPERAVREELVKLQAGDPENLGIWREMTRLSQVQFDTIYGRLGVKFDETLGESHYNDRLKPYVEELLELGLAVESEGAIAIFSEQVYGSCPPANEDNPFLVFRKDDAGNQSWIANPLIVQKSDGAANYAATDLATLFFRMEKFHPEEIIYVTDGRQQLHFRQVIAAYEKWVQELFRQPFVASKRRPSFRLSDYFPVRLTHVWFGSILGDDRRPFKTRTGETIKLADLLDEAEERALKLVVEKNPELPEAERREIARIVGLGAVKYADLLPNRQSDYVFSWDKMLSFQGNTAPYLQYSYVRICSIFRKGGIDEAAIRNSASAIAFSEPAELALAKKLLQFGEVLPQVLKDYRPNVLANYLYELASTFHSFFEACPVLKSEGATRASRLALCDTTARLLQQGLALLGIEVPERM